MSDLLLQTLAEKYPTAALALSEASGLAASLELPRPTIHVISDIHGEDKKLRHVINNASGSLRPLVAELFADELSPVQQTDLLKTIYYPREFLEQHCATLPRGSATRHAWVDTTLMRLFRVVRHLAGAHRGRVWERLTAPPYRELFREYFNSPTYRRPPAYTETLLLELASHDQDFAAVRHACRLVRNLSIAEIIVAGDLGDRGPRIDRVIDLLMQQPSVTLTWGNHDISWMGACIGQDALLATVLRISLRYLRVWQLEEGYGIALAPLEKLVRELYSGEPPPAFRSKRGATSRPDSLVARMQLAAAVLQFKLEAQTIRRHPEWGMDDRIILDRLVFDGDGGVTLDGHQLDGFPSHAFREEVPWELLPAEQECLDRLHGSFVGSIALWDHMRWVVENGCMSLTRDHCAIFHACIPTSEDGAFLSSPLPGGKSAQGKAALDAYEILVRTTYNRGGRTADQDSKDTFYYLWAGPASPLFGKDRMATFESYFITEPAASKETKNPYFKQIHDAAFTRRVCMEVGLPDAGDCLLVNGHIPVRSERGESPVKSGGNAVTIDGAFSEAYGDRGYTLILSPKGASLAEHHHFDSIAEAVGAGADIVPTVTDLQSYDPARRYGDTPEATPVRQRIDALRSLVDAYRNGRIHERRRT